MPRGRDEDEFAAFVAARQRSLQRTAWLLTGDWAAAEDLVSQALAKTWLSWGRLLRRDQPQVYVYRVMLRLHATAWRRRWRGEVPHAEPPDRPGPDELAAEAVTRVAVLDALGRLPRRQREVVVLRYFEDLTETQTAAALGVAVGTVKSTTAAAMARLRADPRLGLDRDPVVRTGTPEPGTATRKELER